MTARTCQECGNRFEPIRDGNRFCQPKCKAAYNNRRTVRGQELYDLFMACRHEREKADELGLWTIACKLATQWKNEDQRHRAGRKSWNDARGILQQKPHLTAAFVGIDATGKY